MMNNNILILESLNLIFTDHLWQLLFLWLSIQGEFAVIGHSQRASLRMNKKLQQHFTLHNTVKLHQNG